MNSKHGLSSIYCVNTSSTVRMELCLVNYQSRAVRTIPPSGAGDATKFTQLQTKNESVGNSATSEETELLPSFPNTKELVRNSSYAWTAPLNITATKNSDQRRKIGRRNISSMQRTRLLCTEPRNNTSLAIPQDRPGQLRKGSD